MSKKGLSHNQSAKTGRCGLLFVSLGPDIYGNMVTQGLRNKPAKKQKLQKLHTIRNTISAS